MAAKLIGLPLSDCWAAVCSNSCPAGAARMAAEDVANFQRSLVAICHHRKNGLQRSKKKTAWVFLPQSLLCLRPTKNPSRRRPPSRWCFAPQKTYRDLGLRPCIGLRRLVARSILARMRGSTSAGLRPPLWALWAPTALGALGRGGRGELLRIDVGFRRPGQLEVFGKLLDHGPLR